MTELLDEERAGQSNKGARPPRRRALARTLAAGMAVLALGVAACGGESETGGAEAADSGKKKVRIGLFTVSGNTYAEAAGQEIKKVADAEGATVRTFDSAFDPQKQFAQVQDAIATGQYDAFILLPVDGPSLVPAVEAAVAKGIAVTSFNQPLGTDLRTSELQVEGQSAAVLIPPGVDGENIAEVMVSACEGVDPCNVGYIMGLAQLPLDRVKWEVMQKAAKDNPNIKIVARGEGKYLPDPSIRAAQDMIQANKDLDVIVAVGDQMAIGVEQAIKDAKLEGKIKIVGDGGSEIGVEAVRAGRWFGTTLNIPMTEGKLVAELAIRAGRGEKVSEGVNTLDHRGEIPPILTQSNKDEWTGYKAQWKG